MGAVGDYVFFRRKIPSTPTLEEVVSTTADLSGGPDFVDNYGITTGSIGTVSADDLAAVGVSGNLNEGVFDGSRAQSEVGVIVSERNTKKLKEGSKGSQESDKQNRNQDPNAKRNALLDIIRIAVKDGRLTWNEAAAIRKANTDPNTRVTVSGSQLVVELVDKENVPDVGGVDADVVGFTDWLVHGRVTVQVTDGVVTGITSEEFDFEMKDWFDNFPRNVETKIGGWWAGEGEDFHIDFQGAPTVKP